MHQAGSGFGQGGGFGQAPPPPRGNNTGLVVAVALLALAVGFGAFALSRDQGSAGPVTVAATTTAASTQPPSTQPPSTQPPTSPVVTPTTPSPSPTTPSPTTTTPTTPAQQPTGTQLLPQRSWDQLPGPHSSNQEWVVLQQNRIYDYDIPTMTCPDVPSSYTSAEQFRTWATHTFNCQHNGWVPVFRAMGANLPRPKLTFIGSEPVQSACGKVQNTSFYCGTWDNSSMGIYLTYDLMEQSNSWFRLRAFNTVTHEYVHHVQHVRRILYSGAVLTTAGTLENMERSRRVELQAQCVAARILVSTGATRFSQADYDIYIRWTEQDQPSSHGSAESNQYWWQRGMYMTKVGGCNTWTVGSSRVS